MKKIIILAAIAVVCAILCTLTIVLNMCGIWTILSGILTLGATISAFDYYCDFKNETGELEDEKV